MYTFFKPVNPEPSIRNSCPKRAKVTSLSGTVEFTSSKNTLVIVIVAPSESLLSQEVNNFKDETKALIYEVLDSASTVIEQLTFREIISAKNIDWQDISFRLMQNKYILFCV